jgi:hypothetical protein
MLITPPMLNQAFPDTQQKHYIDMLLKRGGLTRRRAECFTRLWSYLLLKQLGEISDQLPTITTLYPPTGFISCTHREAAELFYPDAEKGSDRAAGLMIDKLAALGLLDKKFDGQTLCIQIRNQPELLDIEDAGPIALYADDFNPVNDTVATAQLMTRTFYELVRDPATTSLKIAKSLRQWSSVYPKCIRVLRRSDTQNPAGVLIMYPITAKSERLFFDSPSKSFYLTTERETDPFEMALPGDPTCTCIYTRAWIIDQPFLSALTMEQLIVTTQQTFIEMRQDYPALSDIYSLVIHPSYEQLRTVMGFERIVQDSQRAYTWIYLAIDRYLALDPAKTVQALTAGIPSTQPTEGEKV